MGNTLTLHKTGLIEAFNLKAAIEYLLKNPEAAREALTDMPPRGENELDAVTLHNQVCNNIYNIISIRIINTTTILINKCCHYRSLYRPGPDEHGHPPH